MHRYNTSVIIPVYNEEVAIEPLLNKIIALGIHEQYEVIIVDDCSTDNTAAVTGQYPVRLVRHMINKGYGASLKTGIRKAGGSRVIFIDGDGQHDPRYIPEINRLLDEYDLVIGERSAGSYQVKNRRFGKKLIRNVGEYLVEQKLPDFNSGYRGFNRDYLMDMLHLMPNGFSFSTTSTLAFIKEGYQIASLPIEVTGRVGRKSNVRPLKDGAKTMMLVFRIIMLFNPLKVFLPASIGIFLIGCIYGLLGYIYFSRFSNGALVLTTLGMFLFFIGLLADQISIMNRKKS